MSPNDSTQRAVLNELSQISIQGSVNIIVQVCVRIGRFGLKVFIGRTLGPALLGIYTLALSISTVLAQVGTLGIPRALQRELSQLTESVSL